MEESHGWTADVEPECNGAASPSAAAPAASAPSPSYNKHRVVHTVEPTSYTITKTFALTGKKNNNQFGNYQYFSYQRRSFQVELHLRDERLKIDHTTCLYILSIYCNYNVIANKFFMQTNQHEKTHF